MQKSEGLYPKGSDGLCQVDGCREIAEWIITEPEKQVCCDHFIKVVPEGRKTTNARKIPHIVRKGNKLMVRCLLCGIEWMPVSFRLEKDDPDHGKIPHKCINRRCRNTILTMVGRKPRFDRAVGLQL